MVPKLFHFIHLNPPGETRPFTLVHHLAIKSALAVNADSTAVVHCDREPDGEWWAATRPLVDVNVVVPPESIHGNPLVHPAHKGDVLRLRMLHEHGGIYLDLDTISVRPLDPLREHDFVMGEQLSPIGVYGWLHTLKCVYWMRSLKALERETMGFCNAVILSSPRAAFIDIWLDAYRTFRSKGRDLYWDEHSTKLSYELARQHPGLAHAAGPYAFHFPLYDLYGLKMLFERTVAFPHAYVHHLWESQSHDLFLRHVSVGTIKTHDSTYNLLARRFM